MNFVGSSGDLTGKTASRIPLTFDSVIVQLKFHAVIFGYIGMAMNFHPSQNRFGDTSSRC